MMTFIVRYRENNVVINGEFRAVLTLQCSQYLAQCSGLLMFSLPIVRNVSAGVLIP